MPPHNGLFLSQPPAQQAQMQLATPFNDVQMVALLASHLVGGGVDSLTLPKAVADATAILVESFRQRKRLTDGIQAVIKAEAQADLR